MERENYEIALIEYNKKTWCKSAVLGFFIGLAVIVPGISGSTIAIIFKLYDQFLYAVGNLFRQFKKCFLFLLPIAVGMVLGILLGFIAVEQLLALLPFAVIGLFAGLMSGAFPAVKDELKGAQMSFHRIALLIVGVCIPVAIGGFSVGMGSGSAAQNVFASIEWWHILLCLPVGYVVGITQIVPGLSASAILLAIAVYAALGVGFLLGLFTFSKLLTYIFGKARHTAYSLIVGLSLGSIVSMFFNPDVFAVYTEWAESGVNVADLVTGIVLFLLGAIASYLLVRYQRKKDAEQARAAEAHTAAENGEKKS